MTSTDHRITTVRTLLRSDDLNCPSCVSKIEKRLRRTPGVVDATVHFATGRIEVDHDPQEAPVAALVTAVRKAGYRASPTPF